MSSRAKRKARHGGTSSATEPVSVPRLAPHEHHLLWPFLKDGGALERAVRIVAASAAPMEGPALELPAMGEQRWRDVVQATVAMLAGRGEDVAQWGRVTPNVRR